MPYTIDWIVDERVIYLRNEGELTATEIEAMSRELARMSEDAVAPVHIVEDDRAVVGIESLSLDAVQEAFTAPDYEKFGWAIGIMPEKYETVSDVIGRVAELIGDMEYERVETLPEALEFLAEHDATLPDRSEWRLPQA